MSTKEKTAAALFEGDCNCAQAVFGAFCEDWGLRLDTALLLTSGFGGGARCGELCGAASGAIMAIGLKCGADKQCCNQKTIEFTRRFKEENGAMACRELLQTDKAATDGQPFNRKERCARLVTGAVKILENIEFGE